MRPVGPKIEAEGRDQGWGSWGGAASPLHTSIALRGKTVRLNKYRRRYKTNV